MDAELLEKLKALVHSSNLEGSDEEAIAVFQEVNGLAVDGDLGPITARTILAPRFCGAKDRLSATKARWDHTNWDGKKWKDGKPVNMVLKYHVTSALPGLAKAQTDEVIAKALSSWTEVCAVVFVPVPSGSDANIDFTVTKLDKSGGVLAQCELPYGKDTPATTLHCEHDSADLWSDSDAPPNGRIGARHVTCHEVGHGLGLEHLASGNLLAPYYDASIFKPQAGDIAEVVLRYGPPVPVTPTTPAPIPPTNPGTKLAINLTLAGVQYLGQVQAVSS